ncbi:MULTISPECIES: metallophosphatase domain-containing protein [unclassified Kaistella]|uniref:metallophosphoesterase family protein n=1 Tax=unclassified Kaistella TaxID=2762626 RepID=UPI00273629AD|nr:MULTISPECIES: metallophosphatase domain-containing protein [unclassified Kaistella]MDP2454152.1 metallophosphatase domain-containing protein [Kaistella sp. SH11-4b]MDP2457777.1 metallophosphatase domain-containing protein [Kaistella sp. SH40-3]MDP2460535.1 metallophosphatase domain-containing protein [Kaistella sp. SH19-2b]
MKIVFISDTHGQHRKLKNLPKADLIIHGGDVSKLGKAHEVEDFIYWFLRLDYAHKIFIAGNHDFYFEDYSRDFIQKKLTSNCHYLCDSGVEIEGVKIWGSPVTPTFFNWAFNVDRGKPIQKYWNMIPSNTDILVTHGPVGGILDGTTSNINAGCDDLLKTVNKVKPKFHLFGHIHEAYGEEKVNETTFVNGSLLNEYYNLVNSPWEFEYPKE